MIKRSIALVTVFAIIIAIGCSTVGPKPGTGGTTSAKTIEKTEHPAVPEGVTCYVCHKRETPEVAFHQKYGKNCEDCHVKSTWMAAKYPHPVWTLTGAHIARCNRCHAKLASYEFTDYQCWHQHVIPGGFLVFHDIYLDSTKGGQAPYEVYKLALASGLFDELPMTNTLGVLQRRRSVVVKK